MKLSAVTLMLLAVPAMAQEPTAQTLQIGPSSSSTAIVLNSPVRQVLSVSCGPHGTVAIDLQTGHAKYDDACDLNEAAKNFWAAVERMYPVGAR